MTEGDGSQMGRTGGKGFLNCSFRWNPDDSDEDSNIGDNDNQEAEERIEGAYDLTDQPADGGIRTGSGKHGRMLTTKVIDNLRSTEGVL